jgi:NitT/TauT family transport system substrate-binding protein
VIDKTFRVLLGVAAVIAMLTTAPVRATDKINVVTSNTGFLYVTAYIAQEMGYFKDADLVVEIADGGGGSNAVADLVGGGSQIGIVGLKNMSEAVRRGVDLKAVGTGMNGFPLVLVYRSDVVKKAGLPPKASLAERIGLMKGSTIAVQDIGGSSGEFVQYLLAQAGLPSNFLTMINLGNSGGQLASLKARKIDGFTGVSPAWESAILDEYGVDLIVPSRDISGINEMNYMIQAVRGDYLKKNPSVVERYLTALRRAQLLVQREPERAKNAFYDYWSGLSGSKPLPENVKQLMWTSNAGSIPTTVALEPDAVKAARLFFKIDQKLSDDQIVDNAIAGQVMQKVK